MYRGQYFLFRNLLQLNGEYFQVPYQVPKKIPHEVCKDIPVEKCHPVPEKVAKQIPKKVSHQVCEDYGYAGHSYGYDRSDDDVKEDSLKLVWSLVG